MVPKAAGGERKLNAPYVAWPQFKERVMAKVRNLEPRPIDTAQLREWKCGADSSCEKVLSAVKFLGIASADGTPDEGVWRTLQASSPETYRAAAADLVTKAYADLYSQIRDIENADDSDLEDEIGRIYGVAVASRRAALRFLKGIAQEGGLTVGRQPLSPPRATGAGPRPKGSASHPGAATGPPAKAQAKSASPPPGTQTPQATGRGEAVEPEIHIDLQVHISPEASAEQIDKIFESIARHLKPKR